MVAIVGIARTSAPACFARRRVLVICAAGFLGGVLGYADAWSDDDDPARGRPALLPAYSHNDYENPRPLWGAFELGYRGVEVDYYVVGGALLVGHDKSDLRPDRTLESLYLVPLREHVRRHGSVCHDGSVFTLNIESKEADARAYVLLHELLTRYADMLTVVRDGVEIPGAVQVVLVGWHPPLDELRRQRERFVSVQVLFHELPEHHAAYPSHLVRMISVEYATQFTWRGGGRAPRQFRQRLARVRAAGDAVPGRITRVFHVPRSRRVYEELLRGGIDLIGTKEPATSRSLLLDAIAASQR